MSTKDIEVLKLKWTQQIQKEYLRYQTFIGNTNMPKYKPNFIDSTRQRVSYSMQTLTYRRPVILNVNMGFMVSGGDKHCQPTLFHEFTHMWDSENLFINKDNSERKNVLTLYTEYHASQIEFLRFIECDSVKHLKNISPTDAFFHFDKQLSVYDYYNDKCSLLMESIDLYTYDKSAANFMAIIDSFMYVFGTKNMYDKYVEPISIPDTNCIFTETMLKIYDLLQTYSLNDLWDLLLLAETLLRKLYIKDSI